MRNGKQKKQRMQKIYTGNPPGVGVKIKSIGAWQLWAKTKTQLEWWLSGETEWLPVKLINSAGSLKKANYSLSFSTERFAKSEELAILIEHHPEVFSWIESERMIISGKRSVDNEQRELSQYYHDAPIPS